MCILVQLAAEAAREERRAQRKAVKNNYCYTSMMSGASAASSAAASPEARTTRPYGKAAARASARGRHASCIAGRWQRDRSRGITRRIRFPELLWAGTAGAGGASTTYLPALPSHLLKLLPLSRLDTCADSFPNPPSISACFPLRSRTVRQHCDDAYVQRTACRVDYVGRTVPHAAGVSL